MGAGLRQLQESADPWSTAEHGGGSLRGAPHKCQGQTLGSVPELLRTSSSGRPLEFRPAGEGLVESL